MNRAFFSVTSAYDDGTDLLALIAAHRGEPVFYLEKRGLAIAAVGTAAEIVSSRPDRFAEGSREAIRILSSIQSLGSLAPDRIVVGGFAFAGQHRACGEWREFPALHLFVPRLLWVRDGRCCRLTKTWPAGSAVTDQELTPPAFGTPSAGDVRLKRCSDPRERELWRERVEWASREISRCVLNKIVIARRIELLSTCPIDPAELVGAARAARPSCFTFWLSGGATNFVGSTPELLVKVEGGAVRSGALAGSAARGVTPEEDRRLGNALLASVKNRNEHQFVVAAIHSALGEIADPIGAPCTPELMLLPEAQHLFTAVTGRLRDSHSALEVAGMLHPTPAVCGVPLGLTRAILERDEPERGWYTGGVGWMDVNGDGEFAVALRCALIEDHRAVAWAGAGIVAGSDPDAEFAETESKLSALFRCRP